MDSRRLNQELVELFRRANAGGMQISEILGILTILNVSIIELAAPHLCPYETLTQVIEQLRAARDEQASKESN